VYLSAPPNEWRQLRNERTAEDLVALLGGDDFLEDPNAEPQWVRPFPGAAAGARRGGGGAWAEGGEEEDGRGGGLGSDGDDWLPEP
jgi:hypothetical protein